MELRVQIGHWDSQLHVGGGLMSDRQTHTSWHFGVCLWLIGERSDMYLMQAFRSDRPAVNDLPCL